MKRIQFGILGKGCVRVQTIPPITLKYNSRAYFVFTFDNHSKQELFAQTENLNYNMPKPSSDPYLSS